MIEARAELFPHGADVGVRGVGATLASAFEQGALALTSAATDPAEVVEAAHRAGLSRNVATLDPMICIKG